MFEILELLLYWVIFHAFLLSDGFFFKMNFFEKFLQERYQCQTVRIQIRAEVLGPNCLQKFFLIMLSSLSCFYCHLLAFFFSN